jgi:regulator of protease activity HflC (stomatin/prohibitin superfamily)
MLRFIVPLALIIIPIISIVTMGFAGIPTAIILDVILIALSIRIVSPNTVRTVEFLGKYDRILRQGLNFIIPFLETTKSQVLYRRNFPVEVEGVTSDNVTAYIGLNVIYYVHDDEDNSRNGAIYKSVYSIDDPRTMMRSTIDEQLRGMIVAFTHKQIFAKREEIWNAIEEKLREKLAGFGYKLDSIQVRDVKLEGTVMGAMNKVVESEKLKEAAMNEAEAQKIMRVKEAEAEKESKILLGEGMAGQRTKIAEGFKDAVDMIKQTDSSLNAEKVLQFLLDSSRIETLGNVGENNAKVIYLNEDLEGRTLSKGDKLIAGSELI